MKEVVRQLQISFVAGCLGAFSVERESFVVVCDGRNLVPLGGFVRLVCLAGRSGAEMAAAILTATFYFGTLLGQPRLNTLETYSRVVGGGPNLARLGWPAMI